jgi:hypothetical protein
MNKQPIDRATIFLIAAEACVDPRTARAELEHPSNKRTIARDRIRDVLVKRTAGTNNRAPSASPTDSQ